MLTNAYEGIKKIYKAEIMALIATILLLIGSIISVTGVSAGEATSTGTGLLIGGGLTVIVAGILLIIAAIMNIIGVNRASKDEAAFKNALIALLVGILASVISSAFSGNATVTSLCKAVNNVTEILASYFICTGIINLADRLKNSEMSARGQKVRSILMGIWVLAAVMNFLATLFASNATMQSILGIIALVGGIISIVAYFLYIGLLGRAKKMLEQ